MKKIQVSYLGLNSLFGRVTTNLLKQSPCIEKLSLYDEDETSITEGEANVFYGKDQLTDAVKDVDIVVIGDEHCSPHEEERLKIIGPKIIRYTEAILASSPNAIIVVAASPLNILVPLAGHFLGHDWQNRLLGITAVDTLRASRILNKLLNAPIGQAHVLPVIGGSSPTSRVPMFSHLHPKTDVGKDIRDELLEKMKLYDNSQYQEMDSVERAYSTVRFIHSLISGMLKESHIPEIAMTKTKDIPNADYCSLPMLLGKNGIERTMKLPQFDENEEKMFLEATERLAEDSRKVCNYINSLAQESVRNSAVKTLKSSESSNDQKEETNYGFSVTRGEDTPKSPAIQVNQKVKKMKTNESNESNLDYPKPVNATVTSDKRSLNYHIWAKPSDNDKEFLKTQTVSRKSIPESPSYQFASENLGRKTPAEKESFINTGNETTSKYSDGGVLANKQILTQKNETKQDLLQPSAIQHLFPEILVPETLKTESCLQKKSTIKPFLKDSDVSADESVDSESTSELLDEVNDHLGALETFAGTMAGVGVSRNEVSRKLKKVECVRADNNEEDKIERKERNSRIEYSDLDERQALFEVAPIKSHKVSRTDLDNNCNNRKCLTPNQQMKKYKDEDVAANEEVENKNITTSYGTDMNDAKQVGFNDDNTSSALENDFDKTEVQYQSSKIIDKVEASGYNRRIKKQRLIDNISAHSKEVFSNIHNDKLERITQGTSVDGEKRLNKIWAMNIEEPTNFNSKDVQNNQVHIQVSNKGFPTRNVMGEEKIPCSSSDRSENTNKQAVVNSFRVEHFGQPMNLAKVVKPATPRRLKSTKSQTSTKESSGKSGTRSQKNTKVKGSETTNRIMVAVKPKSTRKTPAETIRDKQLLKMSSTNKYDTKPVTPKISPDEDFGTSGVILSTRSKFIPSDSNRQKTNLTRISSNSKTSADSFAKADDAFENDDFGSSGTSFRIKSKTAKRGDNSSSPIIFKDNWSTNGDDFVTSDLFAAKRRETNSDQKIPSEQNNSYLLETPLKLLNLPGGKQRYELNLQKVDEKPKDGLTDLDFVCETTNDKDLTADKTINYYARQKRGVSLGHSQTVNNPLTLGMSKKKKPPRNSNKEKDGRTQRRKTSKAELSNSRVSVDLKKSENDQRKPATAAKLPAVDSTIQRSSSKRLKKQAEPEKSVNKNNTKFEPTKEAVEDEWNSKYFSKASEMFFKMFKDSVSNNKIELEQGAVRPSNLINESVEVKKKSHERRPGSAILSSNNVSDAPSQSEQLQTNRSSPLTRSTDVRSTGDSNRSEKLGEKSVIKDVEALDIKRRGFKVNAEKRDRVKPMELQKSVRTSEGLSNNKLNMLQSMEGKIESKTPTKSIKGENSVFNTKMTGIEKYQNEKNINLKKEINLSPQEDVEKLFEESSTIPLHNSGATEGKMWASTSAVTDRGSSGLGNQQSFLKGLNATSDKGKGDAANRIDFSVSKISQSSELKSSSLDNNWRAPVVPISSKTIKQVYPPNYKEQVLNSKMRTTEDIPRGEKGKKWDRILTIFKQIITSDIQESRSAFAKRTETATIPSKPIVQAKDTAAELSHTPFKFSVGGKSGYNQKKQTKCKLPSTIKKKTEIFKKKSTEPIRRNRIIKNNPKKIVNYFSKRGHSESTDEKQKILAKFNVNSFEQSPGFFGRNVVNGNMKPAMSIPPKMK